MSDTTSDSAIGGSVSAPETAPHGSHRLWALLLILDCAFVIVFGGLVASKVYQHWNEPSEVAIPPNPHRRPAKAAEPAAKPPEPPPAAPATPPAVPAPSAPAKPSLAESVLPPTSAPAAAADGKVKARPIEFRVRAPSASSVQIVGAFIVHGGRKDMVRHTDGTWTTRLYLNPGQYRYFFFVDGRRTMDPSNPNFDRGASVLTLP
jgi:hypothetical protein